MPSKEYSGGYSRTVHHGNMMNKRGAAAQFQKSARSTKVPMKFKKLNVSPKHKATIHIEETVVKGKPPKTVKTSEVRYTIPDVPLNANIAGQDYVRSHTKLAVVLNEFKTQEKCKHFNEDSEHEIEIV
jgi:hypothetical protein